MWTGKTLIRLGGCHFVGFVMRWLIFYSQYVWIANTDFDLDPRTSVIKRFKCTCTINILKIRNQNNVVILLKFEQGGFMVE